MHYYYNAAIPCVMPIFRPEDFSDPRISAQSASQVNITLSNLLVMSLEDYIQNICRAMHPSHHWESPHVSES